MKVIEIQKELVIEQKDKKVILEKGDKIQVLKEDLFDKDRLKKYGVYDARSAIKYAYELGASFATAMPEYLDIDTFLKEFSKGFLMYVR